MISPNQEKLIIKFLTNQATALELDCLEKWLEDSNNKELFKTFVKINYAVEYNVRQYDSNKVKTALLDVINQDKKVIKLNKSKQFLKYAAAAIVVGILATGYFFKDTFYDNKEEFQSIQIASPIEIGSNKAVLTLEDGKEVALEKTKVYETKNLSSDGETLIYQAAEENLTEITYNYLTIPRGGQFFITLSDGTKVWLNSESKIKYPVSFQEKKPRNVELVYGEAYFDVSPSEVHNGASFIVSSKGQEIEVLGTEFNVKAYQDETITYTTLVEGKIALETNDNKEILKPSQQAIIVEGENGIDIKTVEVYGEISWKDGIFSFKGKSLKHLMKVLSRWYDVEVVFENKELENMTFKGVLSKQQSIEEILSAIKSASVINSFEIKDKTVFIK
ncbi:FecR family protein [Xanthomarina sp. F2636L]|uniref:FecR family protein n=1 Tax=Xanthomarina sp. F2636L TaxID=2996018 RepID=UPI00225E0C6F|nr:FecR family protein [Xanthomarina sp. F2636L]MCX7550058.1 FecR family protein [Xanthomarina sp. F2636L]